MSDLVPIVPRRRALAVVLPQEPGLARALGVITVVTLLGGLATPVLLTSLPFLGAIAYGVSVRRTAS